MKMEKTWGREIMDADIRAGVYFKLSEILGLVEHNDVVKVVGGRFSVDYLRVSDGFSSARAFVNDEDINGEWMLVLEIIYQLRKVIMNPKLKFKVNEKKLVKRITKTAVYNYKLSAERLLLFLQVANAFVTLMRKLGETKDEVAKTLILVSFRGIVDILSGD